MDLLVSSPAQPCCCINAMVCLIKLLKKIRRMKIYCGASCWANGGANLRTHSPEWARAPGPEGSVYVLWSPSRDV